jgi:hypothetical protein
VCDFSIEALAKTDAEVGATYPISQLSTTSKGFEAAKDCAACMPASRTR